MDDKKRTITILGSAGGVARSFLSILNKSVIDSTDQTHGLIVNSEIHLIDRKQKEKQYYENLFPNVVHLFVFHEFDLRDIDTFKKHLERTKTNIVVDLSWADTVEMLQCCNELSVKYVNTALENTEIDDNEELLGVLLVFQDKEVFMYNELGSEQIFSEYKTNATYFQVACGVYASFAVLLIDDIPNGVYYVDELLFATNNRFEEYLKHYMKEFVTGQNTKSDGFLLNRMRKID